MAGSDRSGHYVRQPTGYDAYLPSDLPPDNPPLDLARLLLPLSTAAEALGRLDGAAARIPMRHGLTLGEAARWFVRELKLAVAFAVPSLASGALGGLTGGSLDLDATLTQLNQRQTITAPASSPPASGILNGIYALESQFGSLASLFAGSTGSLAS